jgi:outer membrane protein TolC
MIPVLLLAQLATASPLRPALVAADSIPVVTLAEALERAVKLRPDYVRALGSVAEAEWSRKAARLAFFVPSASVSLDYAKYSKAFFNIGTFNQSSTSSTFNLGANYEIFSARKFAELGRSAAELEQATASEVQQRFLAALQTEASYYAVLTGAELVRVGRDRVGRAEQQLEVARARVQTGDAVQTDSLTVRLELIRARVSLLAREAELRVARLDLGGRIGSDGPVDAAPLDAGAPPPLPLGLHDAVTRALDQGPAYRVARARERQADEVLQAHRGSYLPTLTLSAGHSRFDVKLFPGASNVSSVTLTASLPLWDNGQRELGIIRARSDRNVARALRSDLELSAQRDVTQAYDGYETARASWELAVEANTAAVENYRVEDARYRSGATKVVDLIAAQNNLSDAEAGVIQARYATRLARAQLEAILGTRFDDTQGGSQ